MARGKAHSDEVRAAALSALLAGQGVTEVARKYRLPKSTVSELKKQLTAEDLEQVRTEKRERLVDLIEDHLRASLGAATEIARKVTRDDWFFKQDAESVGVLYGILTDKAIRILEASEQREVESE